ncbi:MAG: hypothetical protein AAGI10_13870 [Pseudomonadota bacterium]
MARQGKGARYDAAEAPADDLLQMRRATAIFARAMAGLDDSAMFLRRGADHPHTPARVLAEVGYEARRLALALEPMCATAAHQVAGAAPEDLPSIELAETLPARALRHLVNHSAIHLDVCLRDLRGAYWAQNRVVVSGNNRVWLRDLPRWRAQTLEFQANRLTAAK